MGDGSCLPDYHSCLPALRFKIAAQKDLFIGNILLVLGMHVVPVFFIYAFAIRFWQLLKAVDPVEFVAFANQKVLFRRLRCLGDAHNFLKEIYGLTLER